MFICQNFEAFPGKKQNIIDDITVNVNFKTHPQWVKLGYTGKLIIF